MDSDIERQIEEIHALAKDNHRMLRAIRRGQWLSFLSTVIVWIVVLALPLFLYQQYLQPLITKFSASGTTTTGVFGLPTSADIQKLINSYTTGK
ncbi:MAG: hypothetical protein NTY93_01275 [Candidatus Kaiserbacteria bacterium]|nr:hypothetical protein [Candidatus Kaiserbacteria bacterium]